jgi:hypothetical protein
MMKEGELSMEEAVFLYTQCKIDIVKKFRSGLSPNDLDSFDQTLKRIDQSLEKQAERIQKKLTDEQ